VLLGAGTALVYPTLIAAMSDAVTPVERAPIVGVYRFWRDTGYVFGGLIAGGVADALGYGGAIACVAALTAASGLWVLFDMPAHAHPSNPSSLERMQVSSMRQAAVMRRSVRRRAAGRRGR
jgi:MFS family permease